MAKSNKAISAGAAWKKSASILRRSLAALGAVVGVFIGGFLWEQISPLAYGAVFLIIASIPILLKAAFWKKLLWLLPVLFFRVMGKILLKVFGSHAMERLFRRYGLLEQRYSKLMSGVEDTKQRCIARWNRLSRPTQAHLILLFLPFLGLLAIAVLIVEILRFRVLQMVVEKLLQRGVQDKVQLGVDKVTEKVKQAQAASRKAAETAGRVGHGVVDRAVEPVGGGRADDNIDDKLPTGAQPAEDPPVGNRKEPQ